jgi:hypothetical protein
VLCDNLILKKNQWGSVVSNIPNLENHPFLSFFILKKEKLIRLFQKASETMGENQYWVGIIF